MEPMLGWSSPAQRKGSERHSDSGRVLVPSLVPLMRYVTGMRESLSNT
jgi:hypothetical protein